MSRSFSYIGLHEDAMKWLEINVNKIPKITCPDCGEILGEKWEKEEYSREEYFFEDVIFEEYTLKDGSKVKEVEQCCPWASGPCLFLCLEKEDGERIFEWANEEIEERI